MEKSFLTIKVWLPFCIRKEIDEHEFVDDMEWALQEIGLELDPTCPECGGEGVVYVDDEHAITCEECDGEGYYSIERTFDQYLQEKGMRFRDFLEKHEEWILPTQVPGSIWGQLKKILEDELRGLEKDLVRDRWEYFLIKSVKIEEVGQDGWIRFKFICKVKDVSVSWDEVERECDEFAEWLNVRKTTILEELEDITKKEENDLWRYALQNDWRRLPRLFVH